MDLATAFVLIVGILALTTLVGLWITSHYRSLVCPHCNKRWDDKGPTPGFD